MIHRIRINKRKLFGPDGVTVSAATTTWVSGMTLPTPNVTVSNTVEFDQNLFNKSIVIPLELKFEPMDYSDIIDNWVYEETQRVINKILDGEKIQYTSTVLTGVTVNFRFVDEQGVVTSTNGYVNSYLANGFDLPDEYNLNRFKKSYFRLYFYDSNNSEKANLLFTEDLPVTETIAYGPGVTRASFVLKKLQWDKEDVLMENTLTNRLVYMEAKFFNAKNGKVQTFYNPPTTKSTPINITEYSDVNNRSWRTVPIEIINRNNNNGEYRFRPLNFGGSNETTITMSEFKLI